MEKVTGKVKKVSGDDKHELEVQFTPADGYCFWHSMLSCLDFDNWKAVPRKDSGYSVNSRLVKEEEDKARALATMVMATATKNGADTARIADISKTGCVEVVDVQWLVCALKMNIRCTISDEVGAVDSGCDVADIYT